MPISSPPDTIVYGSSLRAAPVEVTLQKAATWAARYGITRITDTTQLDRIGIPVCASIRPGAQRGSLCVSAGKGLTLAEARIGAYMEALELALAEWGAAPIEVVMATPEQVLDGATRPEAILDFCPNLEAQIPLDEPLACVRAEDILTGETSLVPAELVFLPAPDHLVPKRHFGTNSTGLASGNTLLEATVHGLAECIERDITSFFNICDTSFLIPNETLPAQAAALTQQLERADLDLYVRYQPNVFGMPWIHALISEKCHPVPLFINGGYGCHPHRSIAVVRAICEAVQSRLSIIHGGRDDLIQIHKRMRVLTEEQCEGFVRTKLAQAGNATRTLSIDDLPDGSHRATTLKSTLEVMVEALEAVGLKRIYRVPYTAPDADLQVVRILVPKLELFVEGCPRVGIRLRDYAHSLP